MKLDPLYHWSPTSRRAEIRKHGLHPGSPPTVARETTLRYICLAPTPSLGWGLSGAMEWMSEVEEWDLWQVGLDEHAEVHPLAFWGPHLSEIRVSTPIAPDHLWLVGRRDVQE